MVKNYPPKKSIMCNPKICSAPLSMPPAFSPSLTHTHVFHPHLECLHVSTAQGNPLCTSHQHKQNESCIKPSTTKTHEKKAWTQNISPNIGDMKERSQQSHQYQSALRIRPLTSCRHSFIPPPQTYSYFY